MADEDDLADALCSDIQALLSSTGRYFTTHDILKSLGPGYLRRDISRCLYELERYGLVERVAESPPTWILVSQSSRQSSTNSPSSSRYSNESYKTSHDSYYSTSHNAEDELPFTSSSGGDIYPTDDHAHFTDDGYPPDYHIRYPPPPEDPFPDDGHYPEDIPYPMNRFQPTDGTKSTVKSDILELLLHSSNPKTATEIACGLGLRGAPAVNGDLMLMETEGVLRRIFNPHSPVLWELASRPEREGPLPRVTIEPHSRNTRTVSMTTGPSKGRSSYPLGSSSSHKQPLLKRPSRFSSPPPSHSKYPINHPPPPFPPSSNKRPPRLSSAPQRYTHSSTGPPFPIKRRTGLSTHSQPPQRSSLPSSSSNPPVVPVPSISREMISQVMQHLSSAQSPLRASAISTATGISRQNVNSILYRLEKDGMVLSVKGGKGPPLWTISMKGSAESGKKSHVISTEATEKAVFNIISSTTKNFLNSEQIIGLLRGKIKGDVATIHESLQSLLSKGSIYMVEGSDPPIWKVSTLSSNKPPPNTPSSSNASCQIIEPMIVTSSSAALVNDLNQSAMSILSQYSQVNGLPLEIKVVNEYGPPHNKLFVVAISFGSVYVQAEAGSKKEARRMAADLALQKIRASQLVISAEPPKTNTPTTTQSMDGVESEGSSNTVPNGSTFHDHIGGLARDLYTKLEYAANVPQPGRKVLACFIMQDTESGQLDIVSFGSGTRCITGDMMDLKGQVINDSHAEVVARRSLRRFFYQELRVFYEQGDEAETIFESLDDNLVRVKDTIKFHLYISTAPCGDGAQFSRQDTVNREPPTHSTFHIPTMTTKSQGVLRTKMEGGEGTIPIGPDVQPQTWDGIQQGGRLRTMSCSDKVASWNVLGLQGALLSLFMTPVYLSSLTLGTLHHHGHLSRAVCCRLDDLSSQLPSPHYRVNHPVLGRVVGGDEIKRHTEKTTNSSLNWVINDHSPEIIDGTTGRPLSSPVSQIARVSLYNEFRSICELIGAKDYLEVSTYAEMKGLAKEYQHVKVLLHQYCEERGYGLWLKKPPEQNQFNTSAINLEFNDTSL